MNIERENNLDNFNNEIFNKGKVNLITRARIIPEIDFKRKLQQKQQYKIKPANNNIKLDQK